MQRAKYIMLILIALVLMYCDKLQFAVVEPIPDPELSCTNGSTKDCITDLPGACTNGLQTCQNELWSICNPHISSSPELCDNIDNDCNGIVDDWSQDCSNCLGTGVATCDMACNAPALSIEICDGIDNDCDDSIDNNIDPIICNNDECYGRAYCVHGQWDCDAQEPTPEICDGVDNDCNGQIDESLAQQCESTCGSGFALCSNGTWLECSQYIEPEICDGIDNDCDGLIDEGCTIDIVFALDRSQSMCTSNPRYLYNAIRWINDFIDQCSYARYGLVIFGENVHREGRILIPLVYADTFNTLFTEANIIGCDGGGTEPSIQLAIDLLSGDLDLGYSIMQRSIIMITDESPQWESGTIGDDPIDLLAYCEVDCQLTVITKSLYRAWWESSSATVYDIRTLSQTPIDPICLFFD